MAQKVRIILEDDLDGGPADETIRFGLDGAHYEIDLSSANAARLRDAIRPFVAKARRVQGTATHRTRAPVAPLLRLSATPRPQQFASGLKANGHKVSDRGRIHQDVQDAYYEEMKAQG